MKSICIAIGLLVLLDGCKTTSTVKQNKQMTPVTSNNTTTTNTAKPTQTVNLPVFVPILQLQKQLYDNFFAPTQGRFYPCSGNPNCDDLYKDIYVENPVLKVKGGQITIQLHVAGHANASIFHPGVTGDIILSSTPMVKNDTLFFENVTMERSSQSFLLSIASHFFEKQITSKIQENAWFSFRPLLDKYTEDFRKQMPVKWDASVLLLSLNKLYLNSVTIQETPNEGIIANFSAEFATENSTYGQQ